MVFQRTVCILSDPKYGLMSRWRRLSQRRSSGSLFGPPWAMDSEERTRDSYQTASVDGQEAHGCKAIIPPVIECCVVTDRARASERSVSSECQ